jgi:putative protease
LEHIPEIAGLGVDSIKIEGRAKGVHYAATLTKVYREALDAYEADPLGYAVKPEWLEEMEKVSHRPYTAGFFGDGPAQAHIQSASAQYIQSYVFVGLVLDYDPERRMAVIQQRNHFKAGERLEFCPPAGPVFHLRARELYNEAGERVASAPHPGQILKMPLDRPAAPWTLIRRADF